MKDRYLIVIGMVLGLTGVGFAQAERKRPARPMNPDRPVPAAVLEKFDTNGDGKLDEEERKAMREARAALMEEARKKALAEFDKDGDGKLDEEERKAMREANRKRVLERFDKDGDGELSEEERAEMRKARQGEGSGGPGADRPRRGQRGEGGGRPQRRGNKSAAE